jgi:predicted RNA-binding protein with PUA-like domain
MAYWLLKTEPAEFAWSDQVKRKVEPWSGVRNAQARNFMKAMRKGERAFFYHTGNEKQVVGIVEVVKPFYPDPADDSGRWGLIDVTALAALPKPVTLASIKAEPKLADLLLVRHSRLSVMPVDETAWALIAAMGGLKA